MKLKKIAILLCSLAVLSFVACKSTPAAEVEPEKDESQTEEVPVEEKKDDFSSANSKLIDKVDSARDAAIQAEAKKYFPELFAETESKYNEFKKNIAENPDKDYSADAADLVARYASLEKAANAKAMKETIEAFNFSGLDPKLFEAGNAALDKYAELGASASGKDLLPQAELAYNSYSQLLLKGYVSLINAEKEAALAAKKNAESVKAQLAKKDEYANATAIFQKADTAKNYNNVKDKKAAYEGFKTSKEIYTEIYETVKKNREEAQAAIDRAKKRVAESESYSVEADSIAPLSEKVDGIEDENAVLLEKDTFSNPDDAIIQVDSSAAEEPSVENTVKQAANALEDAK